MFLTDFCTRKYTGGIISRVGIFLTVTPVVDVQIVTLEEMSKLSPEENSYIWKSWKSVTCASKIFH